MPFPLYTRFFRRCSETDYSKYLTLAYNPRWTSLDFMDGLFEVCNTYRYMVLVSVWFLFLFSFCIRVFFFFVSHVEICMFYCNVESHNILPFPGTVWRFIIARNFIFATRSRYRGSFRFQYFLLFWWIAGYIFPTNLTSGVSFWKSLFSHHETTTLFWIRGRIESPFLAFDSNCSVHKVRLFQWHLIVLIGNLPI